MPTTSDVDVLLMDAFCLRLRGLPIRVPHSTARVIALLAIRDRPLQRSSVATTLWPDHAHHDAAALLRSALWRGGKQLGPIVVADNDQLYLAATVSVDLRRLRRAAFTLRSIDETPQECPDSSVGDLIGELLPGWDEEWLTGERERTRQLAVHALETLCRTLAAAGRFGEAIDAGIAAVIADRFRESAHRVLIEAHLAEGNMIEADRQYERYRRALRDELGLEPSDTLSRLVRGPALAVVV